MQDDGFTIQNVFNGVVPDISYTGIFFDVIKAHDGNYMALGNLRRASSNGCATIFSSFLYHFDENGNPVGQGNGTGPGKYLFQFEDDAGNCHKTTSYGLEPTSDGGYIIVGGIAIALDMQSKYVLKLDQSLNIQWEYTDFKNEAIRGTTVTEIFEFDDATQSLNKNVSLGYAVGGHMQMPSSSNATHNFDVVLTMVDTNGNQTEQKTVDSSGIPEANNTNLGTCDDATLPNSSADLCEDIIQDAFTGEIIVSAKFNQLYDQYHGYQDFLDDCIENNLSDSGSGKAWFQEMEDGSAPGNSLDEYRSTHTFLLRFRINGTSINSYKISHNSGLDYSNKIIQDEEDGSFYVMGTVWDQSTLITAGESIITTHNQEVAAPRGEIVKVDKFFNVKWKRYFKGDGGGLCIFGFSRTEDGGFVCGGNNITAADDYVVVKLFSDCQKNISYTIDEAGLNVASNMTLPTGQVVGGLIEVQNGATLTINNDVKFADTRQLNDYDDLAANVSTNINKAGIIVHEGGRLILDDGANLAGLESECPKSHMWEGIDVYGNGPNDTKGKVTSPAGPINAPIIKDAIVGIKGAFTAYNEFGNPYTMPWHKYGGLVNLHSGKFINNGIGISVPYYMDTDNDDFLIKHVTFEANDKLADPFTKYRDYAPYDLSNWAIQPSGTRNSPSAFIYLYDIENASIGYCNFNNNLAENPDLVAIKGFDGQLSIYNNTYNNVFWGVDLASDTNNNAVHKINNNIFNNNVVGTCVSGPAECVIRNSIYNNNQIGVWLEANEDYYVQDNEFIGTFDFTIDENDPLTSRAIYLDNTNALGGAINRVFRNKIDNIKRGIHAAGDNNNTQLKCNEFSGIGASNIALTQKGNINGMLPNQGSASDPINPSADAPAGNIFNNQNCAEITNIFKDANSNSFTYFYHTGDSKYKPECISANIPISETSILADGTECPDSFGYDDGLEVGPTGPGEPGTGGTKAEYLAQLNQIQGLWQVLDFNHDNAVTTTNVEFNNLLIDIIHSEPRDAKVFKKFKQAGNLASRGALEALINREGYPDHFLAINLFQNSPLPEDIFNQLLNRTPSLKPQLLSIIMNIQNNGEISGIEKIEAYIQSLINDKTQAVKKMSDLHLLLEDQNAAVEIMDLHPIVYSSNRQVNLLKKEDFNAANATLNNLVSTYPETEEDYHSLKTIELDLLAQDKSFYDLSEQQLITIQDIAAKSTAYGQHAKNLLMIYQQQIFEKIPAAIGEEAGKKALVSLPNIRLDNRLGILHISPNPAKEQTLLQFNDIAEFTKNSTLKIYNTEGLMIFESKITEPIVHLNTQTYHSGIYFVEITIDGYVVERQKLIVQ